MPILDRDTVQRWRDMVVVDRNGTTVGTISEFYIDRGTKVPTWALLNTGLFGTKQTFVPLIAATERNGELHLPYPKRQITSAPRIEIDGQLTPDEEALLFAHYDMDYWQRPADEPSSGPAPESETAAPAAAPDAVETIRSEEELQVRPVARERTRARLEKYVVTDQVTQTVPVRREEVRVVHEPVSDTAADAEAEGPSQQEHRPSVVLHEEQPVIDKRVVPRERVRLAKETVTDEREVADQVRKEQVRIDEPGRHEEEDPTRVDRRG